MTASSKPRRESVAGFSAAVDFQRARGHGGRYQQLLGRDAIVVKRVLEFFVDDALVRRMHVDHHQPVPVLGQDIDAG